ncbi:MAG: CPBP family intramembrane glutamic endopeptidase [Pirellulales bacterium]
MCIFSRQPSADLEQGHSRQSLRYAGLAFAIFFPTLITWGYIVFAERYSTGIQQTVYLTAKVIQFAFPAVWAYFILREPLRTSRPTTSGLLMGIAFGTVVAGAGVAIFNLFLRGNPVFTSAAGLIQTKIVAFGIDSDVKYFLLAGFYSLFHSLLEEYYWRWFVFQQLRRVLPLWAAVVVSGVAFTLHHVVVLVVYFKTQYLLIAVLAFAVAIGGWFWAWLYSRSNSIFDTWLSHLLIDAGIFFGVGFELVKPLLIAG